MIITQEIKMELQKIYIQDRGFAGQKVADAMNKENGV